MGLIDTVKGWFNIGGVQVSMVNFKPIVSHSGSQIVGQVLLTSESDKLVKEMIYKFIQQTTKKGQEGASQFVILGESLVGPPFKIRKGETITLDFVIPYSLGSRAQDPSGKLSIVEYHALESGPKANPKVTYTVTAVPQVAGAVYSRGASTVVSIVD